MSIDYGKINIDLEFGIRFGVISQNSILQAWADSSEGTYPCETCDCERDNGEWNDCQAEAIGYNFEGDGYQMTSCLDSDVMVLKSPFFTYAPFCSPCVPGAGNLDDAARTELKNTRFTSAEHESMLRDFAEEHGFTMGVKTYAVGHDWFDPPIAPYPLYGVVSGRPCFPDCWYGDGNDGPWTVIDGDCCQRGHWHLRDEAWEYLRSAHDGINMAGAFVRRIEA